MGCYVPANMIWIAWIYNASIDISIDIDINVCKTSRHLWDQAALPLVIGNLNRGI